MNEYKYTMKDIQAVREEITALIEENKNKVPNNKDIMNGARLECHLIPRVMHIMDLDWSKRFMIKIPDHYVKTNHAKKAGFIVDDNSFKVINLQDIDGNRIDYMYDIRTLKFKELNPNANLDKAMRYVVSMKERIKASFEENNKYNKIFLEALSDDYFKRYKDEF